MLLKSYLTLNCSCSNEQKQLLEYRPGNFEKTSPVCGQKTKIFFKVDLTQNKIKNNHPETSLIQILLNKLKKSFSVSNLKNVHPPLLFNNAGITRTFPQNT